MNGGLKYLQLSNQPLTLDIAFKVAFFISCIQLTRTGNLHTVTVHFAQWAIQPTVRAIAKMTVNMEDGIPIAFRMIPE